MKLILSLCLFAGIAFGNSTSYYGWKPHKEMVFRFESSVDTGIPEIREQQKAGLRLVSTVRIQTFPDYSLRIKFHQPRFMTYNGVQPQPEEEPIPQEMMQYLEQPFKVQMKRGVIETMFVDQSEPLTVTNIKKALLANLNMDITASRRSSIESNRLEVPGQRKLGTSPVDQSYFTVRETSLHGDCQTSYTIHPLPEADAMEVEQQLEQEERSRNRKDYLPGGPSQGKQICQGKPYYQITKTRNFDNCIETPVYQKWTGIRSKCDMTTTSCPDLVNHVSATNYIVCGQIEEFVIRKAVTQNTVFANLAWNTEQKFVKNSRVMLEILHEIPIQTPLQPPTSPKEVKSLIFEYPEKSFKSPVSLNEKLPEPEKERILRATGIKPVLPMPDLKSAPKLLIPYKLDKTQISQMVSHEMEKISREVFESPQSCSSKGDVAGHLSVIAKAFGTLSYDDLQHVYTQVESQMGSSSLPVESKLALKALLLDVLAMTGSNPSVMLVKDLLKSPQQHQIPFKTATQMVQIMFKSVKTPTKELLQQLVSFVKNDLKQYEHQYPTLYTVALVHMSNLLNRACVNPNSRITEYPAKIYGPFCDKDVEVITQEWIPFLTQELVQQQDRRVKLVVLTALGKVGHIKAVKPLTAIISSSQYDPLIKTLAVYSLKRVARLEPVHMKHIILSIIDNPAERPEVRIAAIAILPFSQPTSNELQKIALRTWFEPSKEVASFIYSTLNSLQETQVPELKPVSYKVKPIMQFVKPLMYGVHYSQNLHSSTLVKYLETAINQKFSWIKTKEAFVPFYQSYSTKVYGGAFELTGLSSTTYAEGMDKWLDQLLYYTGYVTPASQQVSQQLREITSKLSIQEGKIHKPEIFNQFRLLDFEYNNYFNEAQLLEVMQKLSDELKVNPNYILEESHFEHSTAYTAVEAEGYGPSDAGFLIYTRRSVPVVYAIKGSFKMEKADQPQQRIPKSVMAKIVPVINVKLEANMGVVSPFTKELIGAGLDMALHHTLPFEVKVSRQESQITLDLKTPDQLTQEIEAIHVYVKPFTVKKSLHDINPISKSNNLVHIVTGEPLKKINYNIGAPLEIDARLIGESDNTYSDLYSYWQKIRQQSPMSLINTFYLPSTMRLSSAKIVYNPQQSQTKELSVSFSLLNVHKESQSASLKLKVPFAQPEDLNEVSIIKQVCKEIYPSDNIKFGQCIMQLSALEVVSDATRQVCKLHPFAECQKYVQICEEAKNICESKSGYTSAACQTKRHACLNRILNLKLIHKTLKEMGGAGSVYAIRVDASIKSASYNRNRKTIHTSFAFGAKKSYDDEVVDVVSNMEFKPTVSSPTFLVKLSSKTKLPKVNIRWNKEQLLSEVITLVLDAKLEYGFENSNGMSQIEVKSKMYKTQHQTDMVQQSPEYKKCQVEESHGRLLSPICEYIRHQAASLDKSVVEITLPKYVATHPLFYQAGQLARAYFLLQLQEYSDPSSLSTPEHLKLVANVSRLGDEAQIQAIIGGKRYEIYNIRLHPTLFKGVVPISVRNPLSFTGLQKLSSYQVPASCRIEPSYISTFDNKTYGYQVNSCWHLLFKDRSGKVPIAVLIKSQQGQPELKKVKILSGKSIVIVTPNGQQQSIEATVEGQPKHIQVSPGSVQKIEHDGKIVIKIMRFQDEVYLMDFPQESLWVLTNGKNVEVSAPQIIRSKSAGLCGDMNGESTLDLPTPQRCQMSKPRYSAYTYMLPEPSCPGVPTNDKPQYEKELRECVREEYIPTHLKPLVDIVAPLNLRVVKPLISVHLVEKQPMTGKICISKQKVQVCPKTQVLRGPLTSIRRRVQYVCFYAASLKAQQFEQMARSGETLTDVLIELPVAFSKTEYEPTTCSSGY